MKNKPDCLSDELLRILKMIWSVFFPLAAYYLISSIAMMILTLVVQDMAAVISKDGIGWSADNENAIQAVSNGIGMLIAAFCLRIRAMICHRICSSFSGRYGDIS